MNEPSDSLRGKLAKACVCFSNDVSHSETRCGVCTGSETEPVPVKGDNRTTETSRTITVSEIFIRGIKKTKNAAGLKCSVSALQTVSTKPYSDVQQVINTVTVIR